VNVYTNLPQKAMTPLRVPTEPRAIPARTCATGFARAGSPTIAPPKRPRGRPRRFDADKQRRVCLLISVGLSRRAAARHIGLPPSSIVYAAARDPTFAKQLRDAEHARANRSPELADLGRRGWRSQRRLLQQHNIIDTRPRPLSPLFYHPDFRRTVRKLVRKYFRKCLAELSIFEKAIDPRFPQTEHEQPLAASPSSGNTH
jgi:hypothetical protein